MQKKVRFSSLFASHEWTFFLFLSFYLSPSLLSSSLLYHLPLPFFFFYPFSLLISQYGKNYQDLISKKKKSLNRRSIWSTNGCFLHEFHRFFWWCNTVHYRHWNSFSLLGANISYRYVILFKSLPYFIFIWSVSFYVTSRINCK